MRVVTSVSLFLTAAAAAVAFREVRAADDIPETRLDRIDYAHPEKYVGLPDTLGRKATIEKIAAEIKGATAAEKLAAIGAWIDAHLKYDANSFDHWRDVDKLLADGTYGGCADHAEFFGAISRACGIPTVWVKTLDLDWIAWFRAHPDQPKSWNGHVFLEVHVDGKWRLLDATQGLLYADYDVKQRILPGHRLAYDKGGDPYELMLSTRWEDWKKQTAKFVRTLDMSLVPVGEATRVKADPPGLVYVAANNPEWQWLMDRCKQMGAKGGQSGNCKFEDWLPGARRGVLVVACVGGKTVLPEQYWPLLPVAPAKFGETLGEKPSAVVRKKAADGTDVVLLLARDKDALKTAVGEFALDEWKARAPANDGGAAPSSPAKTVWVAGKSAEYWALNERLKKLGFVASGGDAAFDKWMPGVHGGTLIVASIGGEIILPESYRSLLPADADKIGDLLKTKASDVLRRKADDGTDVVLLVARDKDAMRALIDGFTLDAPK